MKVKKTVAILLILLVVVSLLPEMTQPAEAAATAATMAAGGSLITVLLAALGMEVMCEGALDTSGMFGEFLETEASPVDWDRVILDGPVLTVGRYLWDAHIPRLTNWILGRVNADDGTLLQSVAVRYVTIDYAGNAISFIQAPRGFVGNYSTATENTWLQLPFAWSETFHKRVVGRDYVWETFADGMINEQTARVRHRLTRRVDGVIINEIAAAQNIRGQVRHGYWLRRSIHIGYYMMTTRLQLHEGQLTMGDSATNPWSTNTRNNTPIERLFTIPMSQLGPITEQEERTTRSVRWLGPCPFTEVGPALQNHRPESDVVIDLPSLGLIPDGVPVPQEEVWNALGIPGVMQPQPETIWEQLERLRNRLREKPGYVPNLQGLGQRMRELQDLLRELGGEGQLTVEEAEAIRGVLQGVDTGIGTLTGAQANAFARQLEDIMQQIRARIQNQPPPSVPGTVFTMFPFCIPWDVYNFFAAIVASPREPVFHFVLFPADFSNRFGMAEQVITIDFSLFDAPVRIFRTGMLITFIVGLIVVTRRYIWTGGG